MASGLSSLRDTPARYATSVLLSSPMMPAWWNASRKRPMRFGSRNHFNAASRSSGVSVTTWPVCSAGFGKFRLRLLHREQQLAQIAFQQIGGESGFLGGALDEPAAFHVPAQVNLVEMKAFAVAQVATRFSARPCRRFFPDRATRYSRPSTSRNQASPALFQVWRHFPF